MVAVDKDKSVEILRHRKACDLCLREKCNKKCEHVKNYTYQQIEKAYDEAISYMESRPIICPTCGRGCFSTDKYCSHCGEKVDKYKNIVRKTMKKELKGGASDGTNT